MSAGVAHVAVDGVHAAVDGIELFGRGKETDLSRLCTAVDARMRMNDAADELPDWKTGTELRDNLTNRMNTYGLVMALLITLTFGQDAPDNPAGQENNPVWREDQLTTVQGWYFFFLYVSTIMFAVGILCVVEILDRSAVTPVFLMLDFMKEMGAHVPAHITLQPLRCL